MRMADMLHEYTKHWLWNGSLSLYGHATNSQMNVHFTRPVSFQSCFGKPCMLPVYCVYYEYCQQNSLQSSNLNYLSIRLYPIHMLVWHRSTQLGTLGALGERGRGWGQRKGLSADPEAVSKSVSSNRPQIVSFISQFKYMVAFISVRL